MKTFINWMKPFALLCFLLFLHVSMSAQCYNELKKEGDRYNRQAIYEEAITQYLAALLCPDLEQDQRIELIKLIKGALQARVDQLQSALSTVVDNLLKSAQEDILNLDYEGALEKIKNAILLQVDEKKVGLAMMELVYFFNESGQYERAFSLSDTLSNLLTIKDLAIQQDTLNDYSCLFIQSESGKVSAIGSPLLPHYDRYPGRHF